MKVTFQRDISHDKFVAFNKASFPGRESEKIINFRYFNPRNPGDFLSNNVVAVDDADNVIGQALYHPAHYYYAGEKLQMEWGFDFFVDPLNRNDAVGLQVLDFVKENKLLPIFASGVGKKALKIQKFYGYHVIGYLKKYFKIVNPLFLISGLLRGKNVAAEKFPSSVGKAEAKFRKVTFENLWDKNEPYNNDVIEFERDRKFLNWRFFSEGFDYVVYGSDLSDNYFAVRTIKVKHITCLAIVDYRVDITNPKQFEAILDAAQKVATSLLLPIIVTGSSLHAIDEVVEKRGFKINGEDRPIVSNQKEYKAFQEDIKARKFVFSTLADSDGEYLM